jgi:hypothetical protein
MATTEVNAGVCGFVTTIRATSEDMQTATVSLDSQCASMQAMGKALSELNAMRECFGPYEDSEVFQAASKHCRHPACPVPAAIIKTVEVACGFALPKNVTITVTKE